MPVTDFPRGFWADNQHLPFVALAPMEDVTDTVFREVVASVSDPSLLNVLFTEFTSTDGMCHPTGREAVSSRLFVSDTERESLKRNNTKLVAQIWGSDPEKFFRTAQMLTDMQQFDGIDINMGCPVKKVVKSKSCSALINHPELAAEILQATREGSSLPVSIKTRIGFNKISTEEWIGHLLGLSPAAIIIHGRTQKMMSEGEALWDEIGRAVQLRDAMNVDTRILGNGDVSSIATIKHHIAHYGVDGVMVGRGIFKNPWMFQPDFLLIDTQMRIELIRKHISLYDTVWQGRQNFNVLKRFFKIYIQDFEGAAHWRDKLMHTSSCAEALKVIDLLEMEWGKPIPKTGNKTDYTKV